MTPWLIFGFIFMLIYIERKKFAKVSVKMKKFKTFYEAQTASRLKEIIQFPTRQKLPTSLEQKFSYGDIHTGIFFPSFSRMQFLG